jgi:bacteriocin biosynthesis cyclodehydratase domain-containing protein
MACFGITIEHDADFSPAEDRVACAVLVQNGVPLPQLLRAMEGIRGRIPVLPVHFNGWTVTMGPTVIDEEPCLGCAWMRRLANYEYPDSSRLLETAKPSVPLMEPWGSLLTTPLVAEILKVAAGPDSLVPVDSLATLVEINLWSAEVVRSRVFKAPDCPICGMAAGTSVGAWT